MTRAMHSLLLLASLPWPALDPVKRYEIHGAPGERLGLSVSVVGDVDQDGRDDWAASRFDGASVPALSVHSGVDGSLLLDFVAAGLNAEGDCVPVVSGLGDLDGDGLPDVALGWEAADFASTNAGCAFAISTGTGLVLHRVDGWAAGIRLGVDVLGLEDFQGDGVADWMCGAARNATASVWSGLDGSIQFVLGSSPQTQFGRALARIGDLDGDGVDDVAVGAPNGWPALGGFVMLQRGTLNPTAPVLAQLWAPPGTAGFGAALAGPGDLDGDGYGDVLIGAPASGEAWLFSGRTQQPIGMLPTGLPASDLGRSVARAGDVDGDGHDDLVLGAWQHGSVAHSGGKIYVMSGKDGGVLATYTGTIPGETLGFDADGMGDVDGDGRADFLVTSAWSLVNGVRSGRTLVLRGVVERER